MPARRATKVLPVEALREATPGSRPPSKRRLVIGALTLVGGVAAVLSALYGDGSPKLLAIGVPAALVGVITLAPVAARPLAALLGWPLRLRGVPGELARQNAMRNPRRTASTATALMIGLTLVVSMGVFASSLKASFSDILSGSTHADLYLAKASTARRASAPRRPRRWPPYPASAPLRRPPSGRASSTARTPSSPRSTRRPPSRPCPRRLLGVGQGPRRRRRAGRQEDGRGERLDGRRSTVPVEFAATGKHDLTGGRHLRPDRWLRRGGLPAQPRRRRTPWPATISTPARWCCWTRGGQGRGEGRDHRGARRPPGRQDPRPGGVRGGGDRLHRPAAHLRDA